jgi:hypothetical protein
MSLKAATSVIAEGRDIVSGVGTVREEKGTF